MDKSDANKAAVDSINADHAVQILVRQINISTTSSNKITAPSGASHRPMLNFKSFCAAGSMLPGIELIHIIRKCHFAINGANAVSFCSPIFYADGNNPSSLNDERPSNLRRLIINATEPPATIPYLLRAAETLPTESTGQRLHQI